MIAHDGGSGAGESGLARCLRAVLPDAWPAFGIDGFADALPARLRGADGAIARRGRRGVGGGIESGADGSVRVGEDFRAPDAARPEWVAATARADARAGVDDVFLGGTASPRRWREALDGTVRAAGRCPVRPRGRRGPRDRPGETGRGVMPSAWPTNTRQRPRLGAHRRGPGGTASASQGRPRQLSSRRRTSSSSHFLVSRGWV
ncbi:hypothetical protein [Streptomyces sp. NPDC018347]|uniref:phosphotransferase-like protein n=1 Tax=Streptomyces sp. NPDC018347 TaxID=3157193 RepID=UPI003400252C